MYDEQENKPLPETHPIDDMPSTDNGGIKVYDRPERRILPIWIWLAALFTLVLVGWLVLQSLQ